MNNLKKFSTEADYSAATLNYPAVSWVTGTDTVHFDKLVPAPNNKVKIAFNLSSREYNGRWYNDIRAWRIEPVGASPNTAAAPAPSPSAPVAPPPTEIPAFTSMSDEDLPF